MLEEIRQQPDALERTLAAELRRVEKFKRLVEKHRPRLIVLVARGTSRQRRAVRPVPARNHHRNSGLAGRALHRHALRSAASTIATRWWWRSRNPANPPTPTWCWSARAAGRAHPRASPTRAPARWRAWPSTSSWCARARRRAWPPPRPTPARCSCSTCWPTRWAAASASTTWSACPRRGRAPRCAWSPRSPRFRERYRFMRHAVVVGRGLNYANAFEFALKLMETCYVVAERFSSADFLHGPIALVEPSFPVFAFAPPGVTWPSIGETLDQTARPAGRDRRHHRLGQPRSRCARHARHPPAAPRQGNRSRRFPTSSPRRSSPPAWPTRKASIPTSPAPSPK